MRNDIDRLESRVKFAEVWAIEAFLIAVIAVLVAVESPKVYIYFLFAVMLLIVIMPLGETFVALWRLARPGSDQ